MMALITALIVTTLTAAGVYLMLRRNLFEILLGVALLSQAVNLVILGAGDWSPAAQAPYLSEPPAIVETNRGKEKLSTVDPARYADPIPQALILTAIVIGFALLSFLIVLMARGSEANGTMELGEVPSEEAGP